MKHFFSIHINQYTCRDVSRTSKSLLKCEATNEGSLLQMIFDYVTTARRRIKHQLSQQLEEEEESNTKKQKQASLDNSNSKQRRIKQDTGVQHKTYCFVKQEIVNRPMFSNQRTSGKKQAYSNNITEESR